MFKSHITQRTSEFVSSKLSMKPMHQNHQLMLLLKKLLQPPQPQNNQRLKPTKLLPLKMQLKQAHQKKKLVKKEE